MLAARPTAAILVVAPVGGRAIRRGEVLLVQLLVGIRRRRACGRRGRKGEAAHVRQDGGGSEEGRGGGGQLV